MRIRRKGNRRHSPPAFSTMALPCPWHARARFSSRSGFTFGSFQGASQALITRLGVKLLGAIINRQLHADTARRDDRLTRPGVRPPGGPSGLRGALVSSAPNSLGWPDAPGQAKQGEVVNRAFWELTSPDVVLGRRSGVSGSPATSWGGERQFSHGSQTGSLLREGLELVSVFRFFGFCCYASYSLGKGSPITYLRRAGPSAARSGYEPWGFSLWTRFVGKVGSGLNAAVVLGRARLCQLAPSWPALGGPRLQRALASRWASRDKFLWQGTLGRTHAGAALR